MRDSIQDAIGSTVADMMDAGLKVSFTQKELQKLGIEIPHSSFFDASNPSRLCQTFKCQYLLHKAMEARTTHPKWLYDDTIGVITKRFSSFGLSFEMIVANKTLGTQVSCASLTKPMSP